MAEVADGLSVDVARMRANLESTNGLIFAERAMMLLAPKIGRDVAHKLLESAAKKSAAEGKRLVEVLTEIPEIAAHLNPRELSHLESPEEYLGSADEFRKAQLGRPAVKPRKTAPAKRARKRAR
jgi:3-carboxy-cis,cis-muconate cycloisomerase